MLADPSSIPYTEKVHEALSEFVPELTTLMNATSLMKQDEHIPAVKWLIANRNRTRIVPLTGDLTMEEQCQIANWFDQHIPNASTQRHKWLGLLPMVHAMTIYITA